MPVATGTAQRLPRVVYVAGYGRSGSTLLERVLGSNEALFATGEICNVLRQEMLKGRSCGCGQPVEHCPVWRPVLGRAHGERMPNRSVAFVLAWVEAMGIGLAPGIARWTAERYRRMQLAIFGALDLHRADGNGWLVDSSKTARNATFRPIALRRLLGLDVRVIHLVRDPRACMWSNLRGDNVKMELGANAHIPFASLRTAFGWVMANLACHLFAWTEGGDRYLRVRYEDFVTLPGRELARIGEFLGVDFGPQAEALARGERFPPVHQISGNRLRLAETVVLRADTEWEGLSPFARILAALVDGWLARMYGYFSEPPASSSDR